MMTLFGRTIMRYRTIKGTKMRIGMWKICTKQNMAAINIVATLCSELHSADG